MPSFEMIATGMLFAENANIAEFIFNGGKLKSQYPLGSQQQNLNNGKNLELDGVNGTIKLYTTDGDIDINKEGIFLNDDNGLNKVSIYNGDIPEINSNGEFGLTAEVITNIPTSTRSGSFTGTYSIDIQNTNFQCTTGINKVVLDIPMNINITQKINNPTAYWQIINTANNTIAKSFYGTVYYLAGTLYEMGCHQTLYNMPAGNYSVRIVIVHPYSTQFVFNNYYVLSPATIKYQNIALGTMIGNNGISFASGANQYISIKKDSSNNLQLNIKGNVNIISEGSSVLNIGSPNSHVNIKGFVNINGVTH